MKETSGRWSFAEIAAIDPARAAALDAAPAPDAISNAVIAQFEASLKTGTVRLGMEESGANSSDLRAVLQFRAGEELFDLFFNANTGYRAQFRQSWCQGIEFNYRIIEGMRELAAAQLPRALSVRRLSAEFEDLGPFETSWQLVCDSLVPDMAKIWWCGNLIGSDGKVERLQVPVLGPKLLLDDSTRWASISQPEEDAWLDVKGAFVGPRRVYQLKDPTGRARKLSISGEA